MKAQQPVPFVAAAVPAPPEFSKIDVQSTDPCPDATTAPHASGPYSSRSVLFALRQHRKMILGACFLLVLAVGVGTSLPGYFSSNNMCRTGDIDTIHEKYGGPCGTWNWSSKKTSHDHRESDKSYCGLSSDEPLTDAILSECGNAKHEYGHRIWCDMKAKRLRLEGETSKCDVQYNDEWRPIMLKVKNGGCEVKIDPETKTPVTDGCS